MPGNWAQFTISHGPLAEALAKELAECLKAEHSSGRRLQLGLSGGRTPEEAYRLLGQMDLPWSHLQLGFGDERVAPALGEGSNWAMARAAFGEAACAQAHWRAFTHCSQEEAHLRAHGPYPLLLLGLGADGHTASLFPDDASWAQSKGLALTSKGPPPWIERLSLSPLAILEAQRVWVVVEGSSKAAVMAQLWAQEPLVIAQVLKGRKPENTLFMLDARAAAALPIQAGECLSNGP